MNFKNRIITEVWTHLKNYVEKKRTVGQEPPGTKSKYDYYDRFYMSDPVTDLLIYLINFEPIGKKEMLFSGTTKSKKGSKS